MDNIFSSTHFIFIHKLDFSIKRKKLHPILLFPQTPRQMQKLKVNVRFIINELPLKEFLFNKDIVLDTLCNICEADSVQSTVHVLSDCTHLMTHKYIVSKWNEIRDELLKLFDSSEEKINAYFSH